MTDGVSGWIPLVSGLIGAVIGPILPLLWRRVQLPRDRVMAWLRLPALEWKHLVVLLAIVVFVQSAIIYAAPIFYVADWSKNQLAASFNLIYDSSSSLLAWMWGLLPDLPERTIDHLLTRPICESDCENFDFIVRDCERKAVEVGGLAFGRRDRHGDVEEATTYFRDCLIAQGLNWESCAKGDTDCRLLYSFRDRGGVLPSFIFLMGKKFEICQEIEEFM